MLIGYSACLIKFNLVNILMDLIFECKFYQWFFQLPPNYCTLTPLTMGLHLVKKKKVIQFNQALIGQTVHEMINMIEPAKLLEITAQLTYLKQYLKLHLAQLLWLTLHTCLIHPDTLFWLGASALISHSLLLWMIPCGYP